MRRKTLIATLLPLAALSAAAHANCDTGAALRQTSAAANPQSMQQQMTRMHDLMHRQQATQDPAERERLQQEHAQLMQEHMRTMNTGMQDMAAQKRAMQSASEPNTAAVGAGPAGGEK